MPIRKFRAIEEMPARPALKRLSADNLRLAFELMELACRLSPVRFPTGVRKYQSVDEANRARAAHEREHARRNRDARLASAFPAHHP